MSYETAPATLMLATRCACCSRPLCDAISVETGVGPECRRKHGFNDAQGAADWCAALVLLDGFVSVADMHAAAMAGEGEYDARAVVNLLVHRVACRSTSRVDDSVIAITAAIRALGFVTLANKIVEHGAGKVEVHAAGDRLAVKTPYNQAFVSALKAARVGARWDGASKVWTVPADPSARKALWGALRAHYAGALLVSDSGTSTVPTAA
jgi:hypothetical protein